MRKEIEPQGLMEGIFEAMPEKGDEVLMGVVDMIFGMVEVDEEVEDNLV